MRKRKVYEEERTQPSPGQDPTVILFNHIREATLPKNLVFVAATDHKDLVRK